MVGSHELHAEVVHAVDDALLHLGSPRVSVPRLPGLVDVELLVTLRGVEQDDLERVVLHPEAGELLRSLVLGPELDLLRRFPLEGIVR